MKNLLLISVALLMGHALVASVQAGAMPSSAQRKDATKRMILLEATPDGLLRDGKPLTKLRFFLPRDGAVEVVNRSGADLKVTVRSGEVANERTLAEDERYQIPAGDVTLTLSVESKFTNTIQIVSARELEILTQVGSSAFFTSGDDFGGYELKTAPTATNPTIVRRESRAITANLSGQVYVAFDDEFGGSSGGRMLTRILTLGSYNPEHHRFGVMAGIAANDADDPTYQVGLAWFLDRKARFVVSAGLMFRRRDELLFGLREGEEFTGTELPVRRVWTQSFFLGLSFNLGG